MRLLFMILFAILVAAPLYSNGEEEEGEGDGQAAPAAAPAEDGDEDTADCQKSVPDMVEYMKKMFKDLAKQAMAQQFFNEQKIRSDGISGLKTVRFIESGLQNYYSNSYISKSFADIRDHSGYKGTLGMGELNVVLNGVEFRTRTNDYILAQPKWKSPNYRATSAIPYPGVPKAVTDLPTVEAQIAEMREWFRAFAEQNHKPRDYRKYFKPVMCYLEGAWTLDEELVEPFKSYRHKLDAATWEELATKAEYRGAGGAQDKNGEGAYLPVAVVGIDPETGMPIYGQWNYRILCKPIAKDIPTSYLRQMEDYHYRYARGMSMDDVLKTRAARFTLYEKDQDEFTDYTLLDDIFYTIPGMDNGKGYIRNPGPKAYKFNKPDEELDTSMYHRWFKYSRDGPMGTNKIAVGFKDDFLFAAQTTQKKILPRQKKYCVKKAINGGQFEKECTNITARYTFAIPVEIVYLTPLLSWNPYNIIYREDRGVIATQGGKDGKTKETAYDGSFLSAFYHTPASFFTGPRDKSDPLDTVRDNVWIKDSQGIPRSVKASGTRIILPDMDDVKGVRLRYPIMPLHTEGGSLGKEVTAVRAWVNYTKNKPPPPTSPPATTSGTTESGINA